MLAEYIANVKELRKASPTNKVKWSWKFYAECDMKAPEFVLKVDLVRVFYSSPVSYLKYLRPINPNVQYFNRQTRFISYEVGVQRS